LTGRSFEHRREWIEDRILELSDCLAVSVYSYSVMSNHFHVVLHVDPTVASSWSDDEVARRWLVAFPVSLEQNHGAELVQRLEMAILSDPEWVKELRKRLGSLSWFMKALKEPIARMANQEDDCTRGRSIEARFFRCAKTADFAFPTMANSGRADSSVRPCWKTRQFCPAWLTWI
jgi:hypothetical protein